LLQSKCHSVENYQGRKKMLRLLCFTPHPDDEVGGFGGTLLQYARRGVETHVICLTPGQAATHRGAAKSDEELAKIRRQEFGLSCKLLEVSRGSVLDFPDGKLDQQDFSVVVCDLVHRVRQIRPQVIITMGPEGAITAHPDHSMVSIFATMAFHWAGRNDRFTQQLENGLRPHQTQKLYYSTALFNLPDRQAVSPPPATTIIEFGAQELETKIAAFRCHASQAPLFPRFEQGVQKRGTAELFHLAASATPQKMEQETDLFAGVNGGPMVTSREGSG
jgi:LmbE family N-acetylglucosaminyl deacetylase